MLTLREAKPRQGLYFGPPPLGGEHLRDAKHQPYVLCLSSWNVTVVCIDVFVFIAAVSSSTIRGYIHCITIQRQLDG